MEDKIVALSPKAKDAMQADREIRRLRSVKEKLAMEIYTKATGVKLPELYPYTDPETGDVYAIRLHADMHLVRREYDDARNQG